MLSILLPELYWQLSSDAVQIFPNDWCTTKVIFDNDVTILVIYSSYSDRVGDGVFNVLMFHLELFQILVLRFNACITILAYGRFRPFQHLFTLHSVWFNPFAPVCCHRL